MVWLIAFDTIQRLYKDVKNTQLGDKEEMCVACMIQNSSFAWTPLLGDSREKDVNSEQTVVKIGRMKQLEFLQVFRNVEGKKNTNSAIATTTITTTTK